MTLGKPLTAQRSLSCCAFIMSMSKMSVNPNWKLYKLVNQLLSGELTSTEFQMNSVSKNLINLNIKLVFLLGVKKCPNNYKTDFLNLGHNLNRQNLLISIPRFWNSFCNFPICKVNWGLKTTAVHVWFSVGLIGQFGPIKFSFQLTILNYGRHSSGFFCYLTSVPLPN